MMKYIALITSRLQDGLEFLGGAYELNQQDICHLEYFIRKMLFKHLRKNTGQIFQTVHILPIKVSLFSKFPEF